METNRKRSYLVTVLLVLMILGCGTAAAYMYSRTPKIENTFTQAEVSCRINERFDKVTGSKSEITVTNTGSTDVFVRVRLVSSWADAGGEITSAQSEDPVFRTGKDWFAKGGSYYYRKPVGPGMKTGNLLEDRIVLGTDENGLRQTVTVLAEVCQSEPADAAAAAWKEVRVSGGMLE